MLIGDIEILPVIDSTMRYDAKLWGKGPEFWEFHKNLLDHDGMIESTIGGYLIRYRGSDRLALVDLGLGTALMMGRKGQARMLESLRSYGYGPEDITDVILTHLHLDHVGWASVDGVPTFPNATYRCHQADWDYWVVGQANTDDYHWATQRDLMKVTESRLQPWTGDAALLPGVDARHVPGHTPGSSIIILSHGEARGMLLGDVVHCPMELIDDEWEGLYDVDPVMAKKVKNDLARELEGSNIPVAAAHFGGLQWGRLIQAEQRRRFVF
jgi:glyoxylase-like metal-dependent hydrolase (beta-lactamase superfamily II)